MSELLYIINPLFGITVENPDGEFNEFKYELEDVTLIDPVITPQPISVWSKSHIPNSTISKFDVPYHILELSDEKLSRVSSASDKYDPLLTGEVILEVD
jgi:hypothetical protein